jgi:hypothetical protein
MLKKAVSKAAASEEARRMLRYVEPLNDARTKLAGFFSILLRAFLPGPHPPGRNHSIHTLDGFDHPFEMAGI